MSASLRPDPPEPAGPASGSGDYGDAPEGAVAYPGSSFLGRFPTCMTRPVAPYIQHGNFGAFFGPSYDFESDGDAGLCQTGICFPPYDADECFAGTDAGLLIPQPFTINTTGSVVPCPNSQGTALGNTCQTATWGTDIDIDVHNHMPSSAKGYVNLLMDWNQDGQWGGSSTCAGSSAPEHVLVNLPVRNPFDGPLSLLAPSSFVIGPNGGYVWARFSITERPVLLPWIGDGGYEDGETEDYLLKVISVQPLPFDWGDAPDPTYPTLNASNGARHGVVANFMLGARIDNELNGQPDPNALGDDNDANGDDEDGVTFTPPLMQGQQACVDVLLTDPAGAGGFLDAWVDFDGNGAWAHPGEQIFASQPLANGNNPNLCFTVPFSATAGTTFARFRLSQQGGLAPTGASVAGEVEDYQITIAPVLTLTKTVTAPVGRTAVISDTVTFQIVIHNAGPTAVTTLPLWDYYSPACLENPSTDPAADGAGTDATLGVLHWADLGPLAAGASRTVTVNLHANRTNAMYWKEGGWLDYAPKGMPDIDQKQDQWDNPAGSGLAWYYCGPVAAANSLWWFDSKFEPNPVSPPAINDGCPIVTAPAAALYDDHSPSNVQNFVGTLAAQMGTAPGNGTNVKNLAKGIATYLANVGLGNQYTVTSPPIAKPTFAWVAKEVRRSEDVILLLGFYQDKDPTQGEYWERTGGHFVTVAGVDLQDNRIAFSDPYNDRAELGAPWSGRVLPAPHAGLHPGVPTGEVHNDVRFASHDVYHVQATTSPGGTWGPVGYVDPNPATGCGQISNFDGMNTPDNMISQPCRQDVEKLVTEVEYAVAVSPITATVTCDPTTNIAVVRGAVDAVGFELPEAQAHAQVSITLKDWGDAPDPTYPTLSTSNGAVHTLSSGLWLGATVDAETNGQQDPQALGDDNDANGDDEDGVSFTTPLVPGKVVRITVTASAPGALDAWLDFNGNGTWEDPGERLFAAGSVTLSAGANNLTHTVPPTAVVGTTFARFRLSTAGGLGPTGPAADGEVEDYKVIIHDPSEYKWVQPYDPSWSGLHTHDDGSTGPVTWITGADDWQCQGGVITDLEWWGNYELDDVDAEERGSGIDHFHLSIHSADPTGLPFPGPVVWQADVPFAAVSETAVDAVNPEGSTLYHYGFELRPPVIQVPGGTYWFDIAARSVVPSQPAIWRWQESSRSTTSFQGLYWAAYRTDSDLAPGTWSSTTSDMAFVISSAAADLGDAPDPTYPTLLAHNGAAHAVIPGGPFMGAGVDTELDGQPDPLALGDDTNGSDDEDGVTFTSALVPGRVATVAVDLRTSPAGCLLNAWLDVNIDGDWTDAGEQIFTDQSLAAGNLYSLTFTVSPVYAPIVGITYARFRCSTQAVLSYAGAASDGEVEDYRVEILAPPKPPVVTASVLSFPTLQLSWPKVTADIYGNARLADGYYIYWNSSPYWTPAPGSHEWWLSEPGLPNPVTQGAAHLGDPGVHHFYVVHAVYLDIWGKALESAASNREGELEFSLVPGSP